MLVNQFKVIFIHKAVYFVNNKTTYSSHKGYLPTNLLIKIILNYSIKQIL